MNTTIELKQSPTTIWIKKGTKNMLDSLGERKDTYDDIIRSLIKESENLKRQLELYKPKSENRIKISSKNLRKSRLAINKGEYIDFLYNMPKHPVDQDFRFKIHYTKVVQNNKEIKVHKKTNIFDKSHKDNIEMAKDYLKIVEKIIRQHIDPMFKIDNKRMLDLEWWKRMFKNLGLSNKAYEEDIEFELIKLGIMP